MGEEVKEKKPNKYVEGFKGFCTFLYNPDDHTVFGRGGSSWGKFIWYSVISDIEINLCITSTTHTND